MKRIAQHVRAVCEDFERQRAVTQATIRRSVPQLLRQLRDDGMSLRQIARALDRSHAYLCSIANEQQRPSAAIAAAVARLAIERTKGGE